MNKNTFLLILAVIFLTIFDNSFSQQEPPKIKTITGAYQRIIHFNPDDYNLFKEGPGMPGSGIMGIYAGDNYLILWDVAAIYVYDINNYTKLTTIKPKFTPRDIIENQGKIYCLSKNDVILIYDTFKTFKEYRFNSRFRTVAEYKSFLAQGKLRSFPDPQKRRSGRSRTKQQIEKAKETLQKRLAQKEKLEYYASLNGEVVWRRAPLRSLHLFQGKIYVNVDHNILDLENDFVTEEDDVINMDSNSYFMVLKQEADDKKMTAFINGNIVSVKRESRNKLAKLNINIKDIHYNNIKKCTFLIPMDDNSGELRGTIPHALINNWILMKSLWRLPKNDYYSGLAILKLNVETKEKIKIKLPDKPRNLGFVTNSLKYYSYSNSYIYAIAYNSDSSFDVLKVEVNVL